MISLRIGVQNDMFPCNPSVFWIETAQSYSDIAKIYLKVVMTLPISCEQEALSLP